MSNKYNILYILYITHCTVVICSLLKSLNRTSFEEGKKALNVFIAHYAALFYWCVVFRIESVFVKWLKLLN